MTPSNFRILNRVLAYHGWEITPRTSEQQLIAIAVGIAETTHEELYDCVTLVSALFATACKQATAVHGREGEARLVATTASPGRLQS